MGKLPSHQKCNIRWKAFQCGVHLRYISSKHPAIRDFQFFQRDIIPCPFSSGLQVICVVVYGWI